MCQRVGTITIKDNYYTNKRKIGHHYRYAGYLMVTLNLALRTFVSFALIESIYIKKLTNSAGRSFAKQVRGWKRLRCSWLRRAWLMPRKCLPTLPTRHTWSSRRASTSSSGMSTSQPSTIRNFTKKRDPSASKIMLLLSRTRYLLATRTCMYKNKKVFFFFRIIFSMRCV